MTSVELAQGLFRGAHIAAAMSVFGTAIFRILVAAPTISLLSAPGDVIQRFDRRATRLVLLALVIAVVAAGLWLLSQAASLAEEGGIDQIFPTIPLVLFQTRFGSILILRLA